MKDYLSRTEDKNQIVKLIKSSIEYNQNLSFAINAKWGAGKSYFIKMIVEDIKCDSYVFYYDSWDNDYYDDPLVGMLDCIKDELNKININKNALDLAKRKIFKKVFEVITSFLDNLVDKKIGFKPFNAFKKVKNFIKECYKEAGISDDFNEYDKIKLAKHLIICSLNKLSKIKPVIFIVDELDRCLPTYALKIVERIHHISENVHPCITIFAVDTNQLEKIIDTLYRFEDRNLDAKGYLRKIIDFSFDLGNGFINDDFHESLMPLTNKFTKQTPWISKKEIDTFIDTLFSNLEMRNIEKIINNTEKVHNILNSEKPLELEIVCFELFIAWAKMKYGDNYIEYLAQVILLNKKDDEPIFKYLTTREDSYYVHFYDKAYDVNRVPIVDLKSLVVFYVLRKAKDYLPSIAFNGRNVPPYLNGFIDDFSSLLEKIQC